MSNRNRDSLSNVIVPDTSPSWLSKRVSRLSSDDISSHPNLSFFFWLFASFPSRQLVACFVVVAAAAVQEEEDGKALFTPFSSRPAPGMRNTRLPKMRVSASVRSGRSPHSDRFQKSAMRSTFRIIYLLSPRCRLVSTGAEEGNEKVDAWKMTATDLSFFFIGPDYTAPLIFSRGLKVHSRCGFNRATFGHYEFYD